MNNDSLLQLKDESYCYLTTTGRVTGNPHEIEIWFALKYNTIYLLSGNMDRSDWVKNLLKNPSVTVQVAGKTFDATARLVTDKQEEMSARNMVADKYNERKVNGSLSNYARSALVVGIDINSPVEN